MTPCKPGRGGFCDAHGGATLSECREERNKEETEAAKEAAKSPSQKFAEREAVRISKMKKIQAGGVEWAIDSERNAIIARGTPTLSMTELLMLHDALVLAKDLRCPDCKNLALVSVGRTPCCGAL